MTVYQWLSLVGVPGVIVTIFSIVIHRSIKKRDKKHDEIEAQNKAQNAKLEATMLGVQALLRDRLKQAFKFHIRRGFADYDDRDDVLNMYTQYEALGPNSVMNDLYEQFTALPLIPKE